MNKRKFKETKKLSRKYHYSIDEYDIDENKWIELEKLSLKAFNQKMLEFLANDVNDFYTSEKIRKIETEFGLFQIKILNLTDNQDKKNYVRFKELDNLLESVLVNIEFNHIGNENFLSSIQEDIFTTLNSIGKPQGRRELQRKMRNHFYASVLRIKNFYKLKNANKYFEDFLEMVIKDNKPFLLAIGSSKPHKTKLGISAHVTDDKSIDLIFSMKKSLQRYSNGSK